MAKQEKLKDVLAVQPVGGIGTITDVPRERRHFRALLVANPNYFGNLVTSIFPPVISLKGNTTYEEIKCVGFQPQADRLEAVVFIKQPFGYGGNICSAGTPEYVRFYLSFDDGATWDDQGYTSFVAHDIPSSATGGGRLEYAVSIPCHPPRRWCRISNVIKARAILSWNNLPPANSPNHVPVWGNVHDTSIQVDPRWLWHLADYLEHVGVKLPAASLSDFAVGAQITAAPKSLSVPELHRLYAKAGVEPHRYAMAEVQKLIASPEAAAFQLASPGFKGTLAELGINIGDLIDKLLATDGSTVYEELDCVGLRPLGSGSQLVAVFRIKRSSGYSGGPCTNGSREYVTFWGDFDNNGTFETCLGTASVQVYDIDEVPREGLEYAVHLPVNLSPYRKPCTDGPRVVPIRAILSWNQAASCANPNWVPTWGNREETLILIPPIPVGTLDYQPEFHNISGVDVCSIDQGTGLATGDQPFGGTICITGVIPAALASTLPDTIEYKLTAFDLVNGTTLELDDPFSLTAKLHTGPGTSITQSISQVASADGYFKYREYGTPALGYPWREVTTPERILGYWNTTSTMVGQWEIRVEARLTGTLAPIYTAATTLCMDGTTRTNVIVSLDQEKPVVSITITQVFVNGAWQPAAPCDVIRRGSRLKGTYSITDNVHVGSYGFVIEPVVPAGGASLVLTPLVSTLTTQSGEWELDTAPMQPCGYAIRLDGYDATIVNCGTRWHDFSSVGFCLRPG